MYYFFLDKMQLPVAPPSLNMKINGSNKTVRLIDDSEINIIKSPGLTDITFEFMVPQSNYPFAGNAVSAAMSALGKLGSVSPVLRFVGDNAAKLASKGDIFSHLESLKVGKMPFQFIVTRMKGQTTMLFSTNIKVTLEDYEIKESTDYGFDQMVSVRLKQYRDYSTKILETDKDGKTTIKKARR